MGGNGGKKSVLATYCDLTTSAMESGMVSIGLH